MSLNNISGNSASQRDADSNFQTGNYPPAGTDSTGSGGYGSATNSFSPSAQRGRSDAPEFSETGLIDQSLDGGQLGKEMQDAKQGVDAATRADFQHEAKRDFGMRQGEFALNPYGKNPDGRKEGEDLVNSQ